MSEAIAAQPSRTGRSWLDITRRILVAVILVLAVVGLIVNIAGLAGTWIVRAPVYNGVTDVSARLTRALGTVDNGLARIHTRVQDAQQTLTQINNQMVNLGNQVRANSPVATRISQLVDSKLGPRIENVRSTASSIHDAVVSFNGVLVALNRTPATTVPRLNDELGAVSQRAQDAQAALQDLRVRLEGVKANLVSGAGAVLRQVTTRINTALTGIKALVNKYQTRVANAQTRVTEAANMLLLLVTLSEVAMTILFIISIVGLGLLISFCWQYVRRGHFPSLHVQATP